MIMNECVHVCVYVCACVCVCACRVRVTVRRTSGVGGDVDGLFGVVPAECLRDHAGVVHSCDTLTITVNLR